MKGVISLLAIVVIAGVLAVALVPGLADSLSSVISGPFPCEDAPYDAECTCPEGEYKIMHMDNTLGLQIVTYFCEHPSERFWYVECGGTEYCACFDMPSDIRQTYIDAEYETFDTFEECQASR